MSEGSALLPWAAGNLSTAAAASLATVLSAVLESHPLAKFAVIPTKLFSITAFLTSHVLGIGFRVGDWGVRDAIQYVQKTRGIGKRQCGGCRESGDHRTSRSLVDS
jgi:hypothetical protein